MKIKDERLFCDIRRYFVYLIPMWLFPGYCIAWGVIMQHLQPGFDLVVLLFFVTVGVPYAGALYWTSRMRKSVSYWRYSLLIGVFPFLIGVAICLVLVVCS